ncbi:MAG TPA: nucleotide exchange factor GrpE [bacterium]|nr:nucleotide exchange factor GrpE [bacterium]
MTGKASKDQAEKAIDKQVQPQPEASEEGMKIEVKGKNNEPQPTAGEERAAATSEPAAAEPPETTPAPEEKPDKAPELTKEQLIDHLQRLAAEFDNFRKRSARDFENAGLMGMAKVMSELLPTLDSFERSLETTPTGDDALAWREGMRAIHRQLVNNLTRLGLERIEPAKGEALDPNVHEVMFAMPSDEVAPDHILEVLISGYKIGKRLLRPAKVKVAMAIANRPAKN